MVLNKLEATTMLDCLYSLVEEVTMTEDSLKTFWNPCHLVQVPDPV